ncbi:hypothetical protein [Limnobacter sp.]|uniref:hypothetical protein n=1 Tax=Limnobacter sp. TaxID=2003368 RepID=UPI0025C1A082|nr:hypothetical protein [Limnobacter sp.]
MSRAARIKRNRTINPAGGQRPQTYYARARRSAQAESTGSLRNGNGIERDKTGRTAVNLRRVTLVVDSNVTLQEHTSGDPITQLRLTVQENLYGG